MARVRLLIGYHGAKYHGWQQQKSVPSIEEAITDAVEKMSGTRIRVRGASRTDAGVHAYGQVACFDEVIERSERTWHRALNRWLPHDINIYAVQKVPDDFHPRHDARGKIYTYRIWTGTLRALHDVETSWQWRRPLDVDAMRAAAAHLIGTHDFSSFRAAYCDARTPVRTVRKILIAHESPSMIKITVEGSAFLKYMVRNLVGSLVWVGKGSRPPHWMKDVLEACDRQAAGETAPSHALTLERIHYPHHPWQNYAGEIFHPTGQR